MEFHKYYFRVIGMFLTGGGLGLIFDEFLNGPLQFWPPVNHEVYGLVLFIIGLFLISKKPKGKD